jgi:ADP-dependent NAD(P)H-hydrate dehydratase / NAD(P)H-hydrate epimerase
MRIVSVAQMRELERLTFEAGTSPIELQWVAGTAVARTIEERWPRPGLATAFVGTGNNGRDAWIAAQCLIEAGWSARLYLCPGHAISDDELGSFQGMGGQAVWHRDKDVSEGVDAALQGAVIAVDGLLGIGARGAPREPLATVIRLLNGRRNASEELHVVAVDAPSGLDSDTGASEGAVIQADCSVVLGAMKQGLLTPRAATFTGELVPVDIGLIEGPPDAPELLPRQGLRGILPPRSPDGHKGSFGRLLVVAGSERYVGAALLVCSAAIRSGVGLVALAAPRWLRDIVAGQVPEATYILLPDAGLAGDPENCLAPLEAELPRYTALAIGPGLSTEGGVPRVVEQLLRRASQLDLPAVVDADALNVLAGAPGWPEWLGERTVITPHLGELARLLGEQVAGNGAPWSLAGRLAREWRATLVIKGPFTAIGAPTGVWVHAGPNPALATAGTGDVLTGIIGALLARGLSPSDAARGGVVVHAAAGAEQGDRLYGGGMAASDLLNAIPEALASLVVRRGS